MKPIIHVLIGVITAIAITVTVLQIVRSDSSILTVLRLLCLIVLFCSNIAVWRDEKKRSRAAQENPNKQTSPNYTTHYINNPRLYTVAITINCFLKP